jgi:hypothetical protein
MSEFTCFVAMPFDPGLEFFYFYLKDHLEKRYEEYGVHIVRGDSGAATGSLIGGIKNQIRSADLIIGDVSGSNANVLYELGLAEAYGKEVIFLTSDPDKEVPVNIAYAKRIKYAWGGRASFLDELNTTMDSIVIERPKSLYEEASKFLQDFNSSQNSDFERLSLAEFRQGISGWNDPIPDEGDRIERGKFLFPKIIKATGTKVRQDFLSWLENTESK